MPESILSVALHSKQIYMRLLFLLVLLWCTPTVTAQRQPAQLQARVNEQRMEGRIQELARYGKDAQGRGYRVAFTRGDIEARNWFMGLMKNAGLEVSVDAAG